MIAIATAVLALAVGSVTAQGINQASCTAVSGTTLSYTVGTSCIRAAVNHATSGNPTAVTVNVEFGIPSATGDFNNPYAPTEQYAIFVWDPSQGSSSTATFTFSSAPSYQYARSGGTQSMTGIPLVRKLAAGGFAAATGTYLYAATIAKPAGRLVLTFSGVSSRLDQLDFVVAVYKLTEAEGNFATTAARAIRYNWKSARSTAALYPITSTTDPTIYLAADSYGPGSDGRLVQDLTAMVTVGTGASITSAGSADRFRFDSVTRVMTAVWDISPAVKPVSQGGQGVAVVPGRLVYSIDLNRNQQGASTPIGIDVTASPGPFFSITPGSTNDVYTEATVMSPGQSLTVSFDGAQGTLGSYATSYHSLIRLSLPNNWYASRFSGSARQLDGTNANVVSEITSQIEAPLATLPEAFATGSASFATMTTDPTVAGAYYVPNTAIGNMASHEPLNTIVQKSWLAGTGPDLSPVVETSYGLNYPLYDNRAVVTRAVYVRLCRSAACASTVITNPRQVEVTLKWDEVKTFDAQCQSRADCVTKDGKHPAQDAASAFSANGDPNRFDTCVLLPSSGNPLVPEARCIECVTSCDCQPGQFCYRFTGVAQQDGIWAVVHEDSRKKVGVCMSKDMNGTTLNQPCKRPISSGFTTASLGDDGTSTTTITAERMISGQPGPIQCGAAVNFNGSYSSNNANNVTARPAVWLWQGVCNIDGRCVECGPTTNGLNWQCSNEQICLDGHWFKMLSVDQTVRTFNNDTRAGTLLTIFFTIFVLLLTTCWMCCKHQREGRLSPRTTPVGGPDATKSASASAYP